MRTNQAQIDIHHFDLGSTEITQAALAAIAAGQPGPPVAVRQPRLRQPRRGGADTGTPTSVPAADRRGHARDGDPALAECLRRRPGRRGDSGSAATTDAVNQVADADAKLALDLRLPARAGDRRHRAERQRDPRGHAVASTMSRRRSPASPATPSPAAAGALGSIGPGCPSVGSSGSCSSAGRSRWVTSKSPSIAIADGHRAWVAGGECLELAADVDEHRRDRDVADRRRPDEANDRNPGGARDIAEQAEGHDRDHPGGRSEASTPPSAIIRSTRTNR